MTLLDGTLRRHHWIAMGLLLLGLAAAVVWVVRQRNVDHEAGADPHGQHAQRDDVEYYTCPMHTSVRKQEPGKCPICGMDLTPVAKDESRSGTVIVDEVRRQRIGVKTGEVERRDITRRIRAVGRITIDETRLADVNLRMGGWVHRLLVAETGQRVNEGQTLFTLYSPELYAAQREFLAARAQRPDGEPNSTSELGRASEQRLRLLGMSQAQVRELGQRGRAWENNPVVSPATGYVIDKDIVEGGRIEAGTRVYRIADLSRVWVDAEVYESDLAELELGQAVKVDLPYVPGRELEGQVDYIYPTLSGATRTGRVRVTLPNPDLALKPDMYANVEIDVKLGERLVVPESAVIYTGPRRIVFVDLGEGRLSPRDVQTGVQADGYIEITSGLDPGELVVTSGNFLIAAESRIRSATEYWGGAHGAH